jgi:hypothetical protein
MSAAKDVFIDYPQEFSAGAGSNSSVYTRLPGFYAIHGWRSDAPGAVPVQTLEDGAIAIMQGEPDPSDVAAAASYKLTPVYTLKSGGAAGSMAVPTGRVFIRFADGVNVGDRTAEINQAGYKVDQKLDYAPHAAWLRASSGSIADALNSIQELQKIADVENVEPQMLMQASYR